MTSLTEPGGGVVLDLGEVIPAGHVGHRQHKASLLFAPFLTLVPRAVIQTRHAPMSVARPPGGAPIPHHALPAHHVPRAIHTAVLAARRADVGHRAALVLVPPPLTARERHVPAPRGLVAQLVRALVHAHDVAAGHLAARGGLDAARVALGPARGAARLRAARVGREEDRAGRVPADLVEAARGVVVLLPAAVVAEPVRARPAPHRLAGAHGEPAALVFAAALHVRDERPAAGLADPQLAGVGGRLPGGLRAQAEVGGAAGAVGHPAELTGGAQHLQGRSSQRSQTAQLREVFFSIQSRERSAQRATFRDLQELATSRVNVIALP